MVAGVAAVISVIGCSPSSAGDSASPDSAWSPPQARATRGIRARATVVRSRFLNIMLSVR